MKEYDDMKQLAELLAKVYAATNSETPQVFTFGRNAILELSPSEIITVTKKRTHRRVVVSPFDRLTVEEPMPVSNLSLFIRLGAAAVAAFTRR